MRLLSVVHGPDVRAELFDDVARADGHELEEWWAADDPVPSGDWDAVLIFGGAMNVDEEAKHPWLRDEDEFIRALVADGVPTLGVCLGGQLLAKAAGAHVGPSPEPEFGFTRVTLADDAADDPLFGSLPREFEVFNAHGYAFHTPESGVELARSPVCAQAFRVGDAAWGVQFHPEIRVAQVEKWLRAESHPDADRLVDELRARYDEWRAFGENLCRAFFRASTRLRARREPTRAR